MIEGRTVQVEDVQADPEYEFKEAARIGNVRTALGVPLVRELGSPIGVFLFVEQRCIHLQISKST